MMYTISTNCTKLYSDYIYARSELIPPNTKITDINSKPGWLPLVLPWKNHWNEHCVIGPHIQMSKYSMWVVVLHVMW
jgi:hypothetical protein